MSVSSADNIDEYEPIIVRPNLEKFDPQKISLSSIRKNKLFQNMLNTIDYYSGDMLEAHAMFIFFYGLIVIIALCIAYTRFEEPALGISSVLSTISNNINQIPIVDLKVINITSNCPDHYTLLSLGQWPGTSSACCDSTHCRKGNCGSEIGSKTQHSKVPVIYNNWKKYRFCAKQAFEFLSSRIDCPLGYIKCYTGGCFRENEGCPITNITLNGSDPNSLIIQKDKKSPGMIGLTISMNGWPCLDNARATPLAPLYLPLNYPRPIGCQTVDPAANSTIDEYSEIELFADNGMQSIIGLKYYKEFIMNVSAQLVLMQKYEIKDNKICLNFHAVCFPIASTAISNYEKYFGTYILYYIISVGISFLLFPSKDYDPYEAQKRVEFGGAFSVSGILILQIILIWIFKPDNIDMYLSRCLEDVFYVLEQQCFEPEINQTLEYFASKYLVCMNGIKLMLKWILYILFLNLIVCFFHFVAFFRKIYKLSRVKHTTYEVLDRANNR